MCLFFIAVGLSISSSLSTVSLIDFLKAQYTFDLNSSMCVVFLSVVLPDLSNVVLFGACIDGVVLRDKSVHLLLYPICIYLVFRCWDVALGPLKQIPMNLFIMYMSGNTISIFPIMMVCMMAWRAIQALMSMSATFKLLESSSQQWLQGLVYLIGNLLGSALAIYKCQSMGLLLTHSSDWLAFIEPPQRMEIMGGGMVL
uniref:ER membrane protein complex subunit 4 n=2 Tax=Mastacembelus armatus TaxID=205130 RepID=A0A3Q3M382_9TELE